ncbi:hypothetical protein HRbin11_01064 [bacterium HR11]|nr:hypothetical protein HRbin11_01064 [bacterium HR11]
MDTPLTRLPESVEERIRRVQHMYKVLWTYYQTAQSLLRTLLKLRRLEDIGLDQVYQQLQTLEQMADRPPELIEPVLQTLEAQLQRAHYVLAQFDSNISPGVTRRYIERLESFDDRFLVYLIQFLLGKYPMTQDDWDKVDLLLTKLAIVRNPKTDQYELRPESRLLQLRAQITQYYPMPYTPVERINELIAEADAIAAEVRKVTSYHDLMEWGLLARIREFKKSVQHLMLHPQLMIPFLRLNLTTKKKFTVLYHQEIERIQASIRLLEKTTPPVEAAGPEGPPAEAERVSEVPPPASAGAAALEGEEFVQVLANLEKRMETIAEMLGSVLRSGTPPSPPPTPLEVTPPVELVGADLADATALQVPELIRPEMEALLQAFRRVDWRKSLSEIAFSEPLSPYAMEPFEVEAFQMGFQRDSVSAEARVAYRLIVVAALCRHLMSRLAREVLDLQRAHPDGWVQHLPRETVERIRAMLDQSEVYEGQLTRLQGLASLEVSIRRRLSRALRKLQRARVGLSLLYDQVEEAWSLQVGPVPVLSGPPPKAVVRVRPETTSLLTWLGWVVAAAMFLLTLFVLFKK